MKSLLLKSVLAGGMALSAIQGYAGSGQIGSATATRSTPAVPLKESIWKKHSSGIGRTSDLKPKNIFSLNNNSLKPEALESLLNSYREFFKQNKIDVTINEKATPELLLQVEALASYVEDILILPRQPDAVIKLTYLNSTRNVLGALVLDHKFIIKKAGAFKSGEKLISHKTVNGVPTTTIFYKEIIPTDFVKLAKLPPKMVGPSYQRYTVEFDFTIARRAGRGLDISLFAQSGYGTETNFKHSVGNTISRVQDKDFMTPDKIDDSIVRTFFSRACNGSASVYTPKSQLIAFPQMSLVRYITPYGEVRYKVLDGGSVYSYSEAELANTPLLRRSYSDIIRQNCSNEEIRNLKIVASDIDDETGINKNFIEIVTRESLAYRFNLQRNSFVTEISCPVGSLCIKEKRNSHGVFSGTAAAE